MSHDAARGPGLWPRWATVVLVLATLALPVGLVGWFVYSIVTSNPHEAFGFDDSSVSAAASTACSALTEAIDDAYGSRVEQIRVGNSGIADLVVQMNALGHDKLADDKPALDWIDDWIRLADARAQFADALERGDATFVEPLTDDGHPISGRMVSVAPIECSRAVSLAAAP